MIWKFKRRYKTAGLSRGTYDASRIIARLKWSGSCSACHAPATRGPRRRSAARLPWRPAIRSRAGEIAHLAPSSWVVAHAAVRPSRTPPRWQGSSPNRNRSGRAARATRRPSPGARNTPGLWCPLSSASTAMTAAMFVGKESRRPSGGTAPTTMMPAAVARSIRRVSKGSIGPARLKIDDVGVRFDRRR